MSTAGSRATMQEEVEAAMAVFDDITRIATDERKPAARSIRMLVKLGLRLGLTSPRRSRARNAWFGS